MMNDGTLKITGMGLVCSMGVGVDNVYRAMCAGENGFRPLSRFEAEPYAQKNGGQLSEASEDAIREEFPDDDLCIAMMKTAGKEALEQGASAGRLGLVLATNFGPMETLEWAWRERLDTGTLDAASYEQFGNVVDIVGDYFGCDGPRVQLSMSCASGAAAASVARDMVTAGRADRVLVLAYDALTEYCWCGLSNLRTITTDVMRPFDSGRSGTIFSEGAAAMLFAAPEAAGNALAWLAGAATNNNAFHMTAPRKEAEGSRLVMAEALRQAGLSAEEVVHVCAHATSTHANDETEAGALRNLFGERLPSMTVAAHKSQLGHMLGAAGLAETIVTVKCMANGVIPPTLNHRTLDPVCEPVNCGGPQIRTATIDTAMTNSAGIGGNNGALVLTKKHGTAGRACGRDVSRLYVRNVSWVLPAGIGKGMELLKHSEWLQPSAGGALEGFSVRGYVKSVKGYLDPGGAYQLAAFSLVAPEEQIPFDSRRGICTITRYGSCTSAYTFFTQLAQKGPRLASPLVFPHGYANTPGNLSAIEFGMCGPHMVYSGRQDVREALEFAVARFADDTADELLVGAYEAVVPAAVPDDVTALNGAVAIRVAATPAVGDIGIIDLEAFRSADGGETLGAVAAFAQLLQRCIH